MDIRKLQRAIVDGLEDVKAHDIVVFNTEHLSPLFERVIVASGTSNRQTKALASSVREAVKSRGLPVLSTEGADNGEWIIVDCGAAVAHIMQPAIRDYYRLEEIWGGKPVKLKLDGRSAGGLVKASEPMPERAPVAAAPGPASPRRKAAAPAKTAKSSQRKTASSPRQPPQGRATGAKSTAPRQPSSKATSPRKGAAPPARTKAAQPARTKATPSRKPAAKRPPTGKSAPPRRPR